MPLETMSSNCLLKTEGYDVVFCFRTLETTESHLDMVVEISAVPQLGSISVKSVPTFIAIDDLRGLIIYFDQHMAALQQNPDHEADTFVHLELGFQVQALAGEVRSDNDGEFTLRLMVNLGQPDAESTRTYFGGEAVVTLKDVKDFTRSLNATLAELNIANQSFLTPSR